MTGLRIERPNSAHSAASVNQGEHMSKSTTGQARTAQPTKNQTTKNQTTKNQTTKHATTTPTEGDRRSGTPNRGRQPGPTTRSEPGPLLRHARVRRGSAGGTP